jgi:hypothetical protein
MFNIGDTVYDSLNHPGRTLQVMSIINEGEYNGCMLVAEDGVSVGIYLRNGIRITSLLQALSHKPYKVDIEDRVFIKNDASEVKTGDIIEVMTLSGWKAVEVAAITINGDIISKGKKGKVYNIWRVLK